MRQLAAQVQPVLGAVHPGALAVDHRIDHLLQVFQPVAAVAHVADRHRVQYRGDAVGHHQRVMAAHRRMGRPVNVRTRGEELVRVVGMQLDQPRQQPAAVAVQRLRQPARAVGEAADHAVLHLQRALHHRSSSTSLTLLTIIRGPPAPAAPACHKAGRRPVGERLHREKCRRSPRRAPWRVR